MNRNRLPRLTALAALVGLLWVAAASAGPGSGSASIAPPGNVAAGTVGEWSITYTAAEVFDDGTLRLTIPSGWTAPQDFSSTSPGYVTVATNEPTGNPLIAGVAGNVVTLAVDTLSSGSTITITYGDDAVNAAARATAATSPGPYTFLVASDPAGSAPTSIGASPSLTVIPAAPAYLAFAPSDTTVTAGTFAPYRLFVFDQFGNRAPVPVDRTVNLIPASGQFYPAGNTTTPVTTRVIPAGQSTVRMDYRATLASGGTPHALTAITASGSPTLAGFDQVNVVAGPLSTTNSLISATSPVIANGLDQSSVVVTSRDAYGNPRQGDTVLLAVTGSAAKVDPLSPTDGDGEALGVVTNTAAELVTVSATINGFSITPTALVTFQAGPVSGATSIVEATTPVVANGVATSTITVTARDANNNAVSGQSVSLAVAPPGNGVLTQPGGVTNSLGQVTGTLTSTVPGLRTVTATIDVTAVTDNAEVTFNAGPVASFQWTVDGAAVAGVAEQVTLRARDSQGNTVTNYTGTVNLSTTSGGVGDGVVQWGSAGLGTVTNLTGDDATYLFAAGDNGVVTLTLTDTRAESIQLAAQDGAAGGTSGTIQVAAHVADKVVLDAGNGQSATVNSPVATPPRVLITDQYNNPVVSQAVTFRVITTVIGVGSVDVTAGGGVDSTGITGPDGLIDCDVWRLGTAAGPNRLRALIPSGSIPSVDFTATGTAGNGTNLVLAPGSKSVTVGAFEVVTATLTDAFNNPRAGTRVDIAITVVDDGTLESNPAHTTTQLSPTARWGNTDAAGQITVRFRAPGTAGLVNTVDASTTTIAQGSVTDAVYTTTASGATNLRITFVDPTTAVAGQAFEFLVEAVDGAQNVDATNTSTVTLTPEALSTLEFSETDFGGTVTQVTLEAGQATVFGRGTKTGQWDFTVSGGGLGPDTDTVTITDTGVIDEYVVATVPSVVAGVTFDVTVEALDVYNNRVVGASNVVNLQAIDDVTTNPALATLLVGQTTLVAGFATQSETYTKAEAIRVRASAAGKEGTSNVLTVSAAAAHRIAKVSGDNTGVAAGGPQVLIAQVLDAFDNPVANQSVSFVILEGGGGVAPTPVNTSASGNAQTTLTTGTVAGDNRVKATILDENPAGLERVDYLVETVAGGIAYFTVIPAKLNPIAGEAVQVVVTAYDAGNNVVSGDNTTQIQLSETGSAQFGTATGTLTGGTFTTTVVDTVAESFTITAEELGGGPPSGTSAAINVTHAGPYRVVEISGDANGVIAGTTRPLEVEVRDEFGNVVPGSLVTFAVAASPGGATITDGVGDPNDGITTTNGAGRAQATLNTSVVAGANLVNAQILDGPPPSYERVTFGVNTVAGGIAKYTVQMDGATVTAGLTRNVTVSAFDSNDNLVDDDVTQVDLTGDPGIGLVFGADPVTLANGVAVTTVQANQVQTYRVRAGAAPGATGLGPAVTVNPADPAGLITGTATPPTITANGVSTTSILSSVVVDEFGNQVGTGTPINVSATLGGTVLSGSPKAVAANGRIGFDLRSSTTVGTSVVTMTSQAGTATGTVNVTFAPPPAFTASNLAPGIVAPGDNVSFSVLVQNTASTDANLTTATHLTFSDGVRTYTANLSSQTTIAGPGSQTLVFVATTVNAAFTPTYYDPNVVLVGTDEFGAPINTTVSTPAQSLLLTSIQIIAINAPGVVSRGQTPMVTVSVKNNGAQPTTINDIDLVFSPPGGLFTPGTITPQELDPNATGQFNIPVIVDPSCPTGFYTIDAVATGDAAGKTVTDNSIAPFPIPSWQILAAANLSYVAGSLTPMTVSRGDPYAFRATIANGGAGVVSLDSMVTYLRFTDGTRVYEVRPSQPYAIAGASQQQIVFKTRVVANAFTAGQYGVTFNLQGTESGASFQQTVTSGADQVAVQAPAVVTAGPVSPDQVSKGSAAAFTVQVGNSGGATVILTPATTEFRFAGGVFTADLSPGGQTTIPPGGATLTFLSTTVSQAIAPGTYPGQLVLDGTENGNDFDLTLATENVVVENAPDVQIVANTPSQSPITADQTRPFKVRMVVRNNGGADVTFTTASIKFIHAGQDRTSQFLIVPPTAFELGGATLNGGGSVDTLTFDVSDNTGNAMTAGMMTIQGFLEVEDVNTSQPVFADRQLGDFLQVQTPAALAVLAVLPSQSLVTQSMNRDWIVRALVQNTGQSDMTLTLSGPATAVTFSSPAGWVSGVQGALGHGGNVLSGGEIDTVLFDITTSGSTTGTTFINTAYEGTETNSGRSVTGGSSGSASVTVQSPGVIDVTGVVASRSTITNGASVPWTLTVTLTNTGQSDVDLELGNAIAVTFQNATAPPALTRPAVLAGGGTILSGGETDQIVIGVGSAGTYSSAGSKLVSVVIGGTEINSGDQPPDGSNNTTVTVQQPPVLNVVSVTPNPVSRGSIVGFQVTIENAAVAGATATLDPLATRLRFGSNNFNVNLLAASPVVVAAGQQITLQFTPAPIVAAIPLGAQNDAVLEFRWTENGRNGSENESMAGDITVQSAPALNIVSVKANRTNVTAGQTSPAWRITMEVRNGNGADVALDLAPAITRLQLNLLGSGANVTSEYTLVQPTALAGGGVLLSSGETDSLIFDVTQAGNTPGNVIVSGFVGGTDQNSQLPVSDNTGDGGSGSFVLQTPGVLNILSMAPSQTTATVGQTGAAAQYTIKMTVRNGGQSAVDLDLSAPTATAVTFSSPAGWVSSVQPALAGGGVRLSGGETDTVVFNVTTTGSTAAVQTISGNVAGIEVNTLAALSDNTADGGTGAITVQTQAFLDILSATPSRPTLTSGAALPWDITVVVQNTGQSAARLLLPAGLTMAVQSAPGAVFDPVSALEEGGVVLDGGATGTLLVHADDSPVFSVFGSRGIGVSLNAEELNSGRAFNRNEPAVGSIIAQTLPDLQIVEVAPNLVTRGGQAFMQVRVSNPGANAATVTLDRGATRVSFGGVLYSAFLQPGSPDAIGANQSQLLAFEDKVVSDLLAPGVYDLNVDLAYAANDLDYSVLRVAEDSVTVQDPPGFRITGITTSQSSATAGQSADWTATMTIENSGSGDIDIDLSAARTYLRFIGPLGQFDNSYSVQQPLALVGGGVRLEVGQTDQLVFTIDQTGTQTGVIVISGRVEGNDIEKTIPVFDDTFDGGRGSISVVPAAAVVVTATHTSQPRVTAGQTTPWDVRVVVANTGGADVDLNLASSRILFNGGSGWVVDPEVVLLGGGNRLEGGAVDSLRFTVTATSPDPGTRRIDAVIPWQDVNTSAIDSALTTTAGFGSILVQTPVNIRVTTTTSLAPNPGEVNIGQAFGVRVQVQNIGQADARDVAIGLTSDGVSTITPIGPITEVAGGQTVAVDFGIDASGTVNPLETFTSAIASATDENSDQPVTPAAALDNTAVVATQNPVVFEISDVRPSQTTVTRGQTIPWNVIVRVRNTGEADAVLAPPAAADLTFSIGGSNKLDYVVQPPAAFGSGTPGWTLAGGTTDSLLFAVNVTGAETGLVDIGVALDGTDRNDPTVPFNDAGVTGVLVQAPAGLAIATTLPVGTVNHVDPNRDIVNTGFAYEIHVTVDNTGEAVDSVLVQLSSDLAPAVRSAIAPASLRRQQIDVDGSHTFVYRVTAPSSPVALETFSAAILSGVRSRNTGQPVNPQPPADNLHVVVTETRADLRMNLTSASGAVSTNQVFTMSATVTNAGQAGVSGPAQLTLALPAGFALVDSLAEPRTRAFGLGTPVNWQVRAPGAVQAAQNFAATIATTPDDRNTGAAAFASQPDDLFAVAVVAGGAFTSPTLAIATPAGAVDDTLSTGQSFTLSAGVTATATTGSIVATLTVPAGFTIVGSPTRNLGAGTGNPMQVSPVFSVIAPANAATGDIFVTFTGTDLNTQQPVPSSADTVAVTTVARASLSVSAGVTAPPDAVDNSVGVSTPFTVTASVANVAGAADIGAPGTLTITLPTGYSLNGGEIAAKQFANVGDLVQWVVVSPAQPQGPDQITVAITAIPPDENSGQPVQVTIPSDAIAMLTEGSAVAVTDVSGSLGLDGGVVPGGTAGVDLLGIRIAYNATDTSVPDAEIDAIAITVVDKDGVPLGNGALAQTLKRLTIDLGGAAPYEVVDPAANPVVVNLTGGGADRTIAANEFATAVVGLDLDPSPRVTEFSFGIRSGGIVVRDPGSGEPLGVTDGNGQPLDGQITSDPLVVLSSNFEEYVHNYPNPFRAGSQSTRIAYFLDQASNVTVRIFAMTGELVWEESIPSSDARGQAGPRETQWDGRNGSGEVVRNGVYVCVLNAGSKSVRFNVAVAK